jgi:hypothetical protein
MILSHFYYFYKRHWKRQRTKVAQLTCSLFPLNLSLLADGATAYPLYRKIGKDSVINTLIS